MILVKAGSWACFSPCEQGRDLEHGEEGILAVLGHSRAHLTPLPSPLSGQEFSQFPPALGIEWGVCVEPANQSLCLLGFFLTSHCPAKWGLLFLLTDTKDSQAAK